MSNEMNSAQEQMKAAQDAWAESVDMTNQAVVDQWARNLGVTQEAFQGAVQAVGPHLDKIKDYLGSGGMAADQEDA